MHNRFESALYQDFQRDSAVIRARGRKQNVPSDPSEHHNLVATPPPTKARVLETVLLENGAFALDGGRSALAIGF